MRRHAQVAHHVKGRLRMRIPSAKGDAAALEEIKRALDPVPGVIEVEVSESIGTVTIHYDPHRHGDFLQYLSNEAVHKQVEVTPPAPRLSEVDEAAEMLAREAEFLSAHSNSAKAVFDFFKKCDLELKLATDNNVDLKVLAPLALAVYAFVELGFEAATPVWLTLGLFSFNHFVDLHARSLADQAGGTQPDRLPHPIR